MNSPILACAALGLCLSLAPATVQAQNDTPLAAKLEQFLFRRPYFPEGFTGSVLVAREGQVILHRSYGFANASKRVPMPVDAIWDWCSVTKQFTAAAILKLQMQGKLKLEDPITKHFRGAPKDKSSVTIRHLLDHTSGLKNDRGYGRVGLFDRDRAIQYLLERPLESEPGKKWRYNNSAYFLLAGLIEKLAGKSYEDYLHEHVLRPAGMQHSGCIGDERIDYDKVPFEDAGRSSKQFAYGPRMSWGYRGAGGVLASTADMFAWHKALRTDAVLDRASRDAMFEPGLSNYGLGWWISRTPSGKRFAYHSGNTGTVVTYFLRYLDEDIVVALAFSHRPKAPIRMAAMSLAGITENAKPVELKRGEPNPVPAVVAEASGEAAPGPSSVAEQLQKLEDPAAFFSVLDDLTRICDQDRRKHLDVLRRLSRAQHGRGTSPEMKLRYEMLAKSLNRRILEAGKRRELEQKLAAALEAHQRATAAFGKTRNTKGRLALEKLAKELAALQKSIRADWPEGTKKEHVQVR